MYIILHRIIITLLLYSILVASCYKVWLAVIERSSCYRVWLAVIERAVREFAGCYIRKFAGFL